MLKDLVLKNRSYRRFDGKTAVSQETMEQLVDLARICPSSRNQQALKFMTVNSPHQGNLIFPCLAWAGYLKDWDGPVAAERPSAYIIILGDTRIGSKFETDLGICAQTILLGAVEMDLGGCIIGSIKRDALRTLFAIPDHLEILQVLAIGKPVEKVVFEPVKDGDIRYWRDLDQTHHVPKRSLSDILIKPDLP
ncbi:MAG: nitroreductase family protein [Bacteroidia bacterium]|nr:nitroreductase family protein [Bacteroidia bacterium]